MSNESTPGTTRRDLLKTVAFVPPVVLTLPAGAAFAQSGSSRQNRQNQQGQQGQNQQGQN